MKSKYRLLLLHSSPGSDEQIAAILEKYFEDPTILFWEMGNPSTKADVLAAMDSSDYNLIISYHNGLILKAHHLRKATYGSINIHPAPPEHGGCWGLWCQPVVCRDQRTFHGVTVHEIDELIDHGPIYLVERWEVPSTATIQSVLDQSLSVEERMLETVCERIAASDDGTRCFSEIDESWDTENRNTPIEEMRRWFSQLDPQHPAHDERVYLNHPRAIISPPYFDDLG